MSARITQKTKRAAVTSLAAHLPPPNTLPLTLALQTTLDVEEQLNILSREAQGVVAHDSLTLRSPVRGLDLRVGVAARHRCAYQITLMDQDLGEIEFSRSRRFGEPELAALESLLAAVVYPLRNALAYHDALRAAYKDPLTGVGSRLALEESLPRELTLARRHNQSLALLAIDLDHFKRVNDQHGHQAGDCALRTVARRIQGAVRTSDQVFRFGGEEFVVVLNNATEEGVRMVAERIRHAVAGTLTQCADLTVQITVSIGGALLCPQDDAATLFAAADMALYQAKAGGRNRVEIHRAPH